MSVLVLLEQRGELRPGAIEAASAARDVAKAAGLPLHAVFIGRALEDQAVKLAGLGIEKLYVYENDSLTHYSNDGYVPIVRALAEELGATVIIGSASALGRELCASVAARLGAELAQDVIGLKWDGGLVATKPLYAGKVVAELRVNSNPAMASLRPNVTKVERDGDTLPEVVKRELPQMNLRTVLKEAAAATGGKIDLSDAKIVVSGGRGVGGPENWHVIENLAEAMGAAVGASRAVVDAGWVAHHMQVGQTGRVVSPDIYVACGISGAIQHQAGMRTAKIIVAINKDANANIFKICDYGIVGDLFEVCPLLAEEVRKARA